MGPGHVVAQAHGNIGLGPIAHYIFKFLVFKHYHLLILIEPETEAALCAHKVYGKLKGIAAAAGEDLVIAVPEGLAGLGPAVFPQKGTDGKDAVAAAVHVGLEVEGHLLYALGLYVSAKVAGANQTLLCSYHHFAAAAEHVAPDVVQEGPRNAAGAAHNDVVGGVYAVAAGAVGAEKVVPAVAVHHGGGFAVYCYVDGLVAGKTPAGGRVKLDHPYVAEIRSVCAEETALGSHEEAYVYGVAVFIGLGMSHFYWLREGKVW